MIPVNRKTISYVTVAAILLSAILITLSCASSNEGSTPTELPNSSETAQSEITPGPKPTIIVSGKSIGSPSAPITVVEYSDFQCHYCQKFALNVEPYIDTNYIQTGKIRFVFKHLIIFGDESILAAEAAECAAEQNQFWPYYHALMSLELSTREEDFTTEKAKDLAQQLGLDMTLFNESLTTGKYRDKVTQEVSESQNVGFDLIPGFLVNGVQTDSEVNGSFEEFSKVLDAELERLGE